MRRRRIGRVGWAGGGALVVTILAACGDHPLALDSSEGAGPQAAVVTAEAKKGGRPTNDDVTIHQWPALTTLRDAAGDGIISDGRGAYAQTGHEFSVAYDYSLTSSKEDRVFVGLYGKGGDPRALQLRIPGVVDMECGWAQYLVSYDDLYEQTAGSAVSDAHLVVRCATDKRAPRYEVTFDPCVVIANPSADRYVASTDESCAATVALDGVVLGSYTVPHRMQADLER